MHYRVCYITVEEKKAKIIFFDNVLISQKFMNFARILASRYLWRWIRKKKKYCIFLFIYFFSIESYLWLLAFWFLMNLKTLIIHVSRNVLSFSTNRVLSMYLSVLLVKWSKTLKIHVFGNVILFFHKVCFACDLVFWYIRSSKTLKGKFLVNIGFCSHVMWLPFFLVFSENAIFFFFTT